VNVTQLLQALGSAGVDYVLVGGLAFALREPQSGGTAVDVLVRPEIAFEQLSERATRATLFGHEIRIAAIDDLVTMKRAAGRPKDLLDIAALQKIQRGEDPNV
jgi:phospholipase/lecithinase/hemolysin